MVQETSWNNKPCFTLCELRIMFSGKVNYLNKDGEFTAMFVCKLQNGHSKLKIKDGYPTSLEFAQFMGEERSKYHLSGGRTTRALLSETLNKFQGESSTVFITDLLKIKH